MSRDVTADQSAALSGRLSGEILAWLRDESPEVGRPLTERALAERLRVSRTPVGRALAELHERGFVDRSDTGRYRVARSGAEIDLDTVTRFTEDATYAALATDRLDGRLPDRVTENELMRRYGVTRARLRDTLTQVAEEGWIEALPGQGWRFLPVLTSLAAYEASYRYRLLVEPAAILEPTFTLDETALRTRRDEQQALVDGALHTVSAATHYELNRRFHECIAECRGNEFFVDGLARINRRRRLIEYRQELRPDRAAIRCREHLDIADLLLAGRNADASEAMRVHLSSVSGEKTEKTSSP